MLGEGKKLPFPKKNTLPFAKVKERLDERQGWCERSVVRARKPAKKKEAESAQRLSRDPVTRSKEGTQWAREERCNKIKRREGRGNNVH